MEQTSSPQYLRAVDAQIAYHHVEGSDPGVIFCGGFMSDMEGSKALALEAYCKANGQSFTRFDYRGHGQSSGDFQEHVISDWIADAMAVFDQVAKGPQVVIGSSMGGWIALRLALACQPRIKGLVLIAPAPDFTSRLMWPSFTAQEQETIMRDGFLEQPSDYGPEPYVITKALIEDGKGLGLLHAPIGIHCPVRILHGQRDADVPWDLSLELADQLESTDVVSTFVKDGDHRLSEPRDLQRLMVAVDDVSS